MSDHESWKQAYDRDGFVVVRQFLAAAELDELLANLDRYIQHVLPTLPDSAAFYDEPGNPATLKQMQHMGADAYFESYRGHPKWTALAESLIGEPATGNEPEWFNKPPGSDHPTPPHQDNYYFCAPPNVATLWLALDSVDEENGCLRYVAGSHRRGIRDHHPTTTLGFSQSIAGYDDRDEVHERTIRLARGDLVAHHCETIHRADPNRSPDRHRRAFAIVFRGASCQRNEQAYHRYEQAMKRQHRQMGLDYAQEP